jgi:predicted GIY-YIG superfamily endonuclease
MPFPQGNSFALSTNSVQAHAPNSSGVYGIFNASQWIYVGESSDIQRRLLAHIQDTEAYLKRYSPTGFSFELQPEASREARRDALNLELPVMVNPQDRTP